MPLNHTVAMLSTFPRLGGTSIGRSSVVEYSDLANYESVTIGDNSMLSGWRNPTNWPSTYPMASNCLSTWSLEYETPSKPNDKTLRSMTCPSNRGIGRGSLYKTWASRQKRPRPIARGPPKCTPRCRLEPALNQSLLGCLSCRIQRLNLWRQTMVSRVRKKVKEAK